MNSGAVALTGAAPFFPPPTSISQIRYGFWIGMKKQPDTNPTIGESDAVEFDS